MPYNGKKYKKFHLNHFQKILVGIRISTLSSFHVKRCSKLLGISRKLFGCAILNNFKVIDISQKLLKTGVRNLGALYRQFIGEFQNYNKLGLIPFKKQILI